MATKSKTVILDSSGLISLLNVADQLHGEALRMDALLTASDWLILLPVEVLAETLNAVGKKIGRRDSVLAGQAILQRYESHDIDLIHAEGHVYDAAIKLLGTGTGNPSFVDCLVMALAHEYETSYIFGFDATFKKNGYILPDERRTHAGAA
jgi:predicted nucleic acid-binding protein